MNRPRAFALALGCAAVAVPLPLPFPMRTGAQAFADEGGGDFADWRNRPHEKFGDADKSFRAARELLLSSYVDDTLTEADLMRAAVAGMLAGAGGRPWDKLMSPAELAEMKVELSGETVGIGVEIKFDGDSGTTLVTGVIPGAPAEKAGLAGGDRILKIDGRSYKGRELRDVVYAIRGTAGSKVTLTVLRDDRILEKQVVRGALSWSPVSELQLPGGVALVAIRGFNDKTPALLREALARVAAARPRALVVDLRADEGGLVERTVEAASLLIPAGKPLAFIRKRGGREEPLLSRGAPVLGGLPTAVLVDQDTASSAELLAGALKTHLSARLVGKRTRGKWNMQTIEELPNRWAIKFTVGVFKSAGGELLDGKGLEPDVEVELPAGALEKARRIADPATRLAADAPLRAAVSLLRP